MTINSAVSQQDTRVSLIGEDALLFVFTPVNASEVPLATQQRVWQLYAWLDRQRETLGLLEIVPGMGNLLLRATQKTLLNTLQDLVLTRWPQLDGTQIEGRTIEIPVHYGGADGPDIEYVAQHCGISVAQLIKRHTQNSYRVFCLGFQPGFAYLGGLDESLYMPRRETPRVAIPAGSVAIAGAQTAIYPSASPGGWHIIGHSDVTLFAPSQASPTLFQIGDTVRFTNIGEAL